MKLSCDGDPFVLLDDASVHGAANSRLYTAPREIVRADHVAEVEPALARIRQACARGQYAAGFLSYEAGFAFAPSSKLPASGSPQSTPLLWFGLFDDYVGLALDEFAGLGSDRYACPGPPITDGAHGEYPAAYDRVIEYIRAGDIYQANLSFRCSVPMRMDPVRTYAAVRPMARAAYSALVSTGDLTILSFSPELFFGLRNGRLSARPMKGTAARGDQPVEDAAIAAGLATDSKQRAENLMIVDLLRNDLSRVSVVGSVSVPRLFAVETYPTVHQMVSDISAVLLPGLSAFDVLRAAFPCGSISAAPKIRAMEVISEVETTPRGIYTGSIGYVDPGGDAVFNVAIRTLTLLRGEHEATLGLGSGIVADSECPSEWLECLTKARFLGRS
jgi:aminodeoxychorismate synthase component I